jgi:hypothetical protein
MMERSDMLTKSSSPSSSDAAPRAHLPLTPLSDDLPGSDDSNALISFGASCLFTAFQDGASITPNSGISAVRDSNGSFVFTISPTTLAPLSPDSKTKALRLATTSTSSLVNTSSLAKRRADTSLIEGSPKSKKQYSSLGSGKENNGETSALSRR